MKNEKMVIEFNVYYKDYIKLTLRTLDLNSQNINCKELLKKDPRGWMITKKHSHESSNFNLTGINSYALLVFDSHAQFSSVIPVNNTGSGSFEAKVSEPHVFLIPMKNFISLDGVKYLRSIKPESFPSPKNCQLTIFLKSGKKKYLNTHEYEVQNISINPNEESDRIRMFKVQAEGFFDNSDDLEILKSFPKSNWDNGHIAAFDRFQFPHSVHNAKDWAKNESDVNEYIKNTIWIPKGLKWSGQDIIGFDTWYPLKSEVESNLRKMVKTMLPDPYRLFIGRGIWAMRGDARLQIMLKMQHISANSRKQDLIDQIETLIERERRLYIK